MVFIPFVEFLVIRQGHKATGNKKKFDLFGFVQKGYETILKWTLKHPVFTLGLGAVSIVLGGLILVNLPQRMMPLADRDQFAVEIYLPQGTAISQTESVANEVYDILKSDERIKSITSFIGMSSPRFQTSYAPNPDSKNYSQFIVNTVSSKATIELLDQYTNELANKWPNAYVKLKQLDYSVCATPVEIRLRGEDLVSLREMADSVMLELHKIEGLVNIHTNQEQSLPYVNVKLDPVTSTQVGVSRAMIASELAMKYTGLPIGSLWEGNYPLNIVLKSKDDYVNDSFDDVGNKYITTMTGENIPLRQISKVDADWHPSQIIRRNGTRSISVMADIKRGY